MISRRKFLEIASLGLLGVGLSQFADEADKPGILLILVDSLNAWGQTFGGHPDAITPNIDYLAQRSFVFTNAHCAGTNSNASRTSLFTGLHPISTGIYHDTGNYRDLYPNRVTLPQFFSQARYQTTGAGRLFHQPDKYSWRDWKFFQYENRFVSKHLADIPSGPNFDWGELDIAEDQMHDYQVADWAIDNLQLLEHSFFLGVGLNTTRHPWYLPTSKYRRFNPAIVTLPGEATGLLPQGAQDIITNNNKHRLVVEAGQWKNALAAYLASIAFVDEQIGRIMRALDQSAAKENTIVVLASTHGLHLGDKRFWLFDTLWEQVTHVPLMITLPEILRAEDAMTSKLIRQSVSLIDLYPTLLDILGYQIDQPFDGVSLLPLMQDTATEWDKPVITALSDRDISLRSDRWRYIQYADGGEELYEYIGDPNEFRNLANDPAHQDSLKRFQELLPKAPAPPVI